MSDGILSTSPIGSTAFLLAALLAASPTEAAKLDLRTVCPADSVMTLLALDTEHPRALFSFPGEHEHIPRWLVSLDPRQDIAVLSPDWNRSGRFGGSFGAGPPLAFERCGPDCVRVLTWEENAWRPRGGPVEGVGAGTLHATWDGGGHAWIALRTGNELHAWVEDGGSWIARGSGRPGVGGPETLVADPDDGEAVLAGTLRFHRQEPPQRWLATVPAATRKSDAWLMPLGNRSAFVLTDDEEAFRTEDGGGRWLRSDWRPWPQPPGGVRLWKPGEDYWRDLLSGPSGQLGVAWFDARRPGEETTILARTSDGKDWTVDARLPGTADFAAILYLGADDWVLVEGCRSSPTAAGISYRRPTPEGRLGPPRLAIFRPTW